MNQVMFDNCCSKVAKENLISVSEEDHLSMFTYTNCSAVSNSFVIVLAGTGSSKLNAAVWQSPYFRMGAFLFLVCEWVWLATLWSCAGN